MSYIKTILAIPADSAATCNTISHVIDPDVGGAETFKPNASANGLSPATHCLVHVQLTPETRALLLTKNGNQWLDALNVYAAERGRTAPSLQACQHMVSVIEIDDEVSVQYILDVEAL